MLNYPVQRNKANHNPGVKTGPLLKAVMAAVVGGSTRARWAAFVLF
jgi:hypothetical protein